MIIEEGQGSVIVNDKRRSFESDAETVTPIQEGETAPGLESALEDEKAIPPADPGPGPYPDEGPALNEAKGPMKFPSLYIPSLLGGQIQFTVSELIPWKGVFFMVVDVKDKPQPHIVLVPMDHTKAHKKIAQKAKQHAPRKKRIGGAPKLSLVPPTTPA